MNGRLLLSSYSENIWEERLRWFDLQAQASLLGPIDYKTTGHGIIRCKDGFVAETIDHEEFKSWGEKSGYPFDIFEVDGSSLFLEVTKT
ncbi:MAG: hypothetical protein P1R58_12000 [bacterium]|nr:hypothetical protein [bacterium]